MFMGQVKQTCVNFGLKASGTSFPVLKDFIQQNRMINYMRQRLKEEAKLNATDSGFEKETLKY